MQSALLRKLIRETLLFESKFQYPGGDSIHGVFDFWRFFIRSDFEEINGRWPTYGEYVNILQSAIPGFVYAYGNNETPDTTFESVFAREPGGKFLDRIYRQLVEFIGDNDRKDLKVCRSIERVGNALRREAKAARKLKRDAEEAAERQRAAEYAATYEPTAPEGSPLERYAFSPQRQMGPNPPPFERNVPVETALLRSINNHLEGERPLTRQQAELIYNFISQGLYPDVFMEPPQGTYYRGMILSPAIMERLGIDTSVIDGSSDPIEMTGIFDISPTGDRFSSSWTSDVEIANAFSMGNQGETLQHVYAVVFAASTEDNPGKFIDATGFYGVDLNNYSDFSSEKEVIGLGTIRANHVRITRIP